MSSLPVPQCGPARWRRAILGTALFVLAAGGPASAGADGASFDWGETYAGVFAGAARTDNRILDIHGFANRGNPGSVSDYDDTGFASGLLAGKRLAIGGVPFGIEFDGMFGDMSASTNQLDPNALDETAEAEIRWVATVRGRIEEAFDRATVFATGGLALARVVNSVTDIDSGPDTPEYMDPDDSFRASSTEVGWVIGVGVEVPLAGDWMLRLDGSYLDFGRQTHYVNHSADNRCGQGNPRRPCPYNVENDLGVVRLAIIHRFGR